MDIKKVILFIAIFASGVFGELSARTLAVSAKAMLNLSALNQWDDSFSVTNFYTEYGVEFNADLFLSKRFSIGANLGRSYFDLYHIFFTEYGINLRWWVRMHHWSLGFLYVFSDPASVAASPTENLMGLRLGWGLSGGEGIPWIFEAPFTVGIMDKSRGLYISAGVQAGLLFNL